MKSARVMDHPRKIENDHIDENEADRSDRGKSDRFHGGFSSGTVACVGRANGDGLGARPIQSADRTDRLLRWIAGGGGELLGTTGQGDTPSVHRARIPFLSAGRGRYAASGVTLPHLDYPRRCMAAVRRLGTRAKPPNILNPDDPDLSARTLTASSSRIKSAGSFQELTVNSLG